VNRNGRIINDITKKIASTKKTSQITNAMQMGFGAKLSKAEQKAKGISNLCKQKLEKLLTHLAAYSIITLEDKHIDVQISFNNRFSDHVD